MNLLNHSSAGGHQTLRSLIEMNNELLVRDPVFQLNILLWMAKEQPAEGYRVRPVFFEHGFKIIYIEQPFPLPEEGSKDRKSVV